MIYRCSAVLLRIPESYFEDINNQVLKFTGRSKRSRIANTILKENKVGGMMLPDFKLNVKLQ